MRIRAAWRLDGDRCEAYHAFLRRWYVALSGEWLPYDGTCTLLGVSYDAVRRCIRFLLGVSYEALGAAVVRCQATMPSLLAGDYSMSSSFVIIGSHYNFPVDISTAVFHSGT